MIIPFQILDLMSKIDEIDSKLKHFMQNNTSSVWVGTLIFGGVIVITFWAIREFSKK